MIYENKLLAISRKIDPQATLAHLAYKETLAAPEKIKPVEGIFLEYAPIARNYSAPLQCGHLDMLKANLELFPEETAHVLEYWIDVSIFSDWKRDNLKKVPWLKSHCMRDVKQYTDLGIRSITSFGAWVNASYLQQYGRQHVDTMLSEYGECLAQQ